MEPKEIRQVRQALGLTSKEMSRGLNVNYQSLDRWEDGSNRPIGIQEAVYEALLVVIARISASRARAIGAQLRLGLGSMLVELLTQSVREVDAEEAAGAFRSSEPEEPKEPEEPAPKTEPSPKPPVKAKAKKAKKAPKKSRKVA